MKRAEVEDLVLELLANAPSSFAALYGFVARQNAGLQPPVTDILGAAAALEKRGWVRARRVTPEGAYAAVSDVDRARAEREYREWLEAPTADLSVDGLSIDEVGLWLEMLPAGRNAWERQTEATESTPRWTLDQDEITRTITIQAADAATAEQALESWLRMNPGIELLVDTRRVQSVSEFRLRDGTAVAGGIRIQLRYREGSTQA